jgi:hypothetical protein
MRCGVLCRYSGRKLNRHWVIWDRSVVPSLELRRKDTRFNSLDAEVSISDYHDPNPGYLPRWVYYHLSTHCCPFVLHPSANLLIKM